MLPFNWRQGLQGGLTILGALALHWVLVRSLKISDRRGWRYLFGAWFIVFGALVVWKREVPVGIEGRPASHVARGWTAVLLGALVVLLGLAVLVIADDSTFG